MRISSSVAHQLLWLLSATIVASALDCGRGTFDNGSKCEECRPGTYQDKTGQNSCIKCPAGSFGRFPGAQGRDLCEPCGEDAISRPGATRCKNCPPGRKATLDGAKCVRCQPGTQLSFGGCAKCDPQTISTKTNVRDCIECPKDSVPDATRTKCVLLKCPLGQEPDSGTCEDCFADSFRGPGMKMCELCPQGSLAGFGFAKCVKCDSGEIVINNGFGLDCESCPAGTNTFAKGGILCRIKNSKCPSAYFQTSSGDCNSCEPGSRYNVAKRRCEKCKKNEVSPGGLTTNCIKCKNGRVATGNRCLCPGGKIFRNGRCINCPAGTFRQNFQDDDRCFPCDPAEQFSTAGSELCSFCPSGTIPSDFAIDCIALENLPFCPDVPAGTKCRSPKTGCAADETRVITDGTPTCLRGPSFLDCGPGDPSVCQGKDGTVVCPVGRVFDNVNRCISCRFGHFLAPDGTCKPCAEDEVSAGGIIPNCVKCPDGFKRARFDGLVCRCDPGEGGGLVDGKCQKLCPPGTEPSRDLRDSRKDIICEMCPAGTFSGTGDVFCKNCPKNTTSKDGASSCTPCPQGQITYGIGDPQCQPRPSKKCRKGVSVKSCLARKDGKRCTVIKVRTTCKGNKPDRKRVKQTLKRSCSLIRDCFIDPNLVIGDIF